MHPATMTVNVGKWDACKRATLPNAKCCHLPGPLQCLLAVAVEWIEMLALQARLQWKMQPALRQSSNACETAQCAESQSLCAS